jgi:hypothetical protein
MDFFTADLCASSDGHHHANLYYKGDWKSLKVYIKRDIRHETYSEWLEWMRPQLSIMGIKDKNVTIYIDGEQIKADLDSVESWLTLKHHQTPTLYAPKVDASALDIDAQFRCLRL